MRIFLLLLLVPTAAAGQDAIFKCIDRQGAIAYQNAPCPDNAKVADIREYEPLSEQEAYRARVEQQQRLEASQQQRSRQQFAPQASVLGHSQRPPTVAQIARKQCAAAKDARAQARKKAPLWRDVHYMRPWDDRVRQACKNVP